MSKKKLKLRSGSMERATNLFMVEAYHLGPRMLEEYTKFLELVYSSTVTLRPEKYGSGYWLIIHQMKISEVGLKVAARLYGVPFTAAETVS